MEFEKWKKIGPRGLYGGILLGLYLTYGVSDAPQPQDPVDGTYLRQSAS